MKTRVYVDLDIEEKQLTSTRLSKGKLLAGDPNPDGGVHFEGFRWLTWVLEDFLNGTKPEGYVGPKVVVQRIHSADVYPDPAGSACYIEGDHQEEDGRECQIC